MWFPSSQKLPCGACLSLAFILSLLSQSWGADRIVKCVFVEPPKDAPETVFLVAPEQPVIELTLPSRNFSPEVEIPNGDLVFAVLPRPLAEGEKVPAGAPIITIPKAWSRCYLLFTHQKANKVFPIEVLPIDGSLKAFPPGHTRIVNHTDALIRGIFGKKTIDIRPRDIENMEPPLKKFGHYPVRIDFLMKGDKKSTPLTQTNWQHDPRSRQVLLITHPDGARFPRIKGLMDRVPVEKKES